MADEAPRRAVLLDTKVLLLLLVGTVDRALIGRFKRTAAFLPQDLDILQRRVGPFPERITTPSVLAEVNSLSRQLTGEQRRRCGTRLQSFITGATERYTPSRELVGSPVFAPLGLTDAAVAEVAEEGVLVLTTDHDLYVHLAERRLPVINFNHERGLWP